MQSAAPPVALFNIERDIPPMAGGHRLVGFSGKVKEHEIATLVMKLADRPPGADRKQRVTGTQRLLDHMRRHRRRSVLHADHRKVVGRAKPGPGQCLADQS
jgi:hypothetical protein